jgi:hypothetical protein
MKHFYHRWMTRDEQHQIASRVLSSTGRLCAAVRFFRFVSAQWFTPSENARLVSHLMRLCAALHSRERNGVRVL